MAIVTSKKTPAREAPLSETSALGWVRVNLFNSLPNTIFSIVILYVMYLTLSSIWQWGVADAVWFADTRRECFDISINGACWAGVIAWLDNIFYGRYPREELWRVNLGLLMLLLWIAPLWLPRVKAKIAIGLSVVFLYPFLAGYIFSGGDKTIIMQIMVSTAIVCLVANTLHALICISTGRGLDDLLLKLFKRTNTSDKAQRNFFIIVISIGFILVFLWQMSWTVEAVSWTKWGGLFLTLVIAGIGIASALPGGILLALGRRSKLQVVRILCTVFIELFRSVPLITVLFMATTMFPLFMPDGFVLNKLTQVIIAVCLFNACYMAEVVRAGLQAIPKGQFEGAHTIGLGYWGTMGFVIMPQALKYMIPNIVSIFIGLLKDTTLVSIIGLFDVLSMLRSISKDTPWLGLHKEPLLFGAMLFFLLCFAISKYSRHMEEKLSTSHKR